MTKALTDDLPLSPKTRKRLATAAKSAQPTRSRRLFWMPRSRLTDKTKNSSGGAIAEADAGGPFASNEDVLKWLKSWGTENQLPAPEATIRF